MKRPHLVLTLALTAGLGTMTLAGDDAPDKGRPKVKTLSASDIVEKLDGKKAKATTVEVTLEPGQAGTPHRHPGPVFGYVIEGEYEWAIDDQPAKMLKAGDTFYEPTKCLHRVSRNPSKKTRTRVLAVLLHPQDVKDLVIPEKPAKQK
jgi:quercetin dioxygenase-like cupin family protein